MSGNRNQNYGQPDKQIESMLGFEADLAGKKDAFAEYEFYTRNKDGKETIDKMSEEETVQAIKELSAHYGEDTIVEFSDDGTAALIENEKDGFDGELFDKQVMIRDMQDISFSEENRPHSFFDEQPAYSGIYSTDKAVAAAVENRSKKEKAFIYGIIRQNFLIKNKKTLTEEERQANISLGVKKAEYAASLLSKEDQVQFLEEMTLIAKLASAGKADSTGRMDYGIKKGSYLGSGSNLIDTANPVDMMRRMDQNAYCEYQKICKESSSEDKLIQTLKYLAGWYSNVAVKDPSILSRYKKQSEEYLEETVKNQVLDTTFAVIQTESKEAFLETLKAFHLNQPNFLSFVIERELNSEFWKN